MRSFGTLEVHFCLVNKSTDNLLCRASRANLRKQFVSLLMLSVRYNENERIHSGVFQRENHLKFLRWILCHLQQVQVDNIQRSLTPGRPHAAETCIVVAHGNSLITT